MSDVILQHVKVSRDATVVNVFFLSYLLTHTNAPVEPLVSSEVSQNSMR